MTLESSARAIAPTRRARHALVGVLVATLALVPLAQISVILQPTLDPELGIFSAALALMTGAGALLGLALIPLLDRMGRVGAILYAVGIAGYVVGNGLGLGFHPNYPTGTPLDFVLAILVPSGYLVLLMGALRSVGWMPRGAVIVGAACGVLVALTVLAPAGPNGLPVEQMANRMVYGALFAAGALVAGIAGLIERGRRTSASEATP